MEELEPSESSTGTFGQTCAPESSTMSATKGNVVLNPGSLVSLYSASAQNCDWGGWGEG